MFPICQFYLRDGCSNPDCIFRHPASEQETVFCVNYARGFCAKGPKCTEKHLKCDASQRATIQQ